MILYSFQPYKHYTNLLGNMDLLKYLNKIVGRTFISLNFKICFIFLILWFIKKYSYISLKYYLYFILLLQTFDYLSILWLLNIEMILIYFLNKKSLFVWYLSSQFTILSPFSVHTPLPSTLPAPSIHPQFLSRKGQISHGMSSCSNSFHLLRLQ